jgi:hypothetical protein
LIENFFATIKQFRAIATRYEKTARNFPAAVQLVASIVSARNDETVQAPVCKLLAQLCKAINEISGHPLPLPRSHASFSELVKRPCDRRMSGKLWLTISPHAVQQHGELSGNRDHGFAPADPFGQRPPPAVSRQGRVERRSRTLAASNR